MKIEGSTGCEALAACARFPERVEAVDKAGRRSRVGRVGSTDVLQSSGLWETYAGAFVDWCGPYILHVPDDLAHEFAELAFAKKINEPPPTDDEKRRAIERALERPTIVCLCGSTRFYEAFMRANYEETMAGKIVLSVGFYPHALKEAHHEELGCTPEQKEALDELHLRKIDMADEVLILNVGGYIGSSTRRELNYAIAMGKRVHYLEPRETTEREPNVETKRPCGCGEESLCDYCAPSSGPDKAETESGLPEALKASAHFIASSLLVGDHAASERTLQVAFSRLLAEVDRRIMWAADVNRLGTTQMVTRVVREEIAAAHLEQRSGARDDEPWQRTVNMRVVPGCER